MRNHFQPPSNVASNFNTRRCPLVADAPNALCVLMPGSRAWQKMLKISNDGIQLKNRGFKLPCRTF